jgi:hypothetical protein
MDTSGGIVRTSPEMRPGWPSAELFSPLMASEYNGAIGGGEGGGRGLLGGRRFTGTERRVLGDSLVPATSCSPCLLLPVYHHVNVSVCHALPAMID